MERDYLRALPPLRFIGALFLVFFHLHSLGFMSVQQPQLIRLVSKGYIGTSLFFVISGFVMMHLYARSANLTPATFYWKRLTRLLPPYYLGGLLSIPVLLFGATVHIQPITLLGQLVLYLSTLQAWVYGQSMILDAPGWSVSVLIFFYLLFPMLRAQVLKLSPSAITRAAVLLWLVYMTPPLIYMLVTPGPTIKNESLPLNFLSTFPFFRLPELVLGMLTAAMYQHRQGQRLFNGTNAVWSCLGLLLSIMMLVPEPNPAYPLFHNGLLTPLLMACILSMAYHQGALSRLGTYPWVQRLGNASLNIFLLHLPLVAYYGRLLHGDRKHWTTVQVLGYLVLLVALSLALEALVTGPLMQRLRTSNWLLSLSRKAKPAPSLVLARADAHTRKGKI